MFCSSLKKFYPHGASPSLTCLRRLITTTKALRSHQQNVPVVTHDGATKRTTVKVDRSQPAINTSPASDEARDAKPFDRSILPKLTPTMKNFTLEGKVAVITGYVLGYCVPC